MTGNAAEDYYQFAIIILTIANIFAIVFGSLLNSLGEKYTKLTGDKATIIRKEDAAIETEDEVYEADLVDVAGGLVLSLSATGVISKNLREGTRRLQTFFSRYLVIIIMVGVGVDLDINELIAALSFQNMIIAGAIVTGATLGSARVGYLVGFYPIDSAVTAGLRMANRGGSGDLAVLGAADRMDLMAYAQLSSRLGGAIVLIIGSIIFSFLL